MPLIAKPAAKLTQPSTRLQMMLVMMRQQQTYGRAGHLKRASQCPLSTVDGRATGPPLSRRSIESRAPLANSSVRYGPHSICWPST